MQTAYNVNPAAGIAGQLATPPRYVIKRIANGIVRPGQWVTLNGATDCEHPDAAGEITGAPVRGGVAIRNMHSLDPNGYYQDGDTVDILVDGEIWVEAEDALTVNTIPFVRHVAADAEELGAFPSDADGTDATACPGIYVRGTSGNVVRLEVNKAT